MSDATNNDNRFKLTDQATLDLLSVLETEDKVSQRSLATRIGVALGLTNRLLKRCVHKGLIKVAEAPARRFSYYVTPKGFGEKSRLVAEYLSTSLSFFRLAKDEYGVLFQSLKKHGIDKIVIYGTGELAEIAILAAHEHDMKVSYVSHRGSNLERFCGYPVVSDVSKISKDDISAIVIASTDAPQESYDWLVELHSEKIVHEVPLLHISRSQIKGAGIG